MRSNKEKKVDLINGLYMVAEDYLVYNEIPKSNLINNLTPDKALKKNVNPYKEQFKTDNEADSFK